MILYYILVVVCSPFMRCSTIESIQESGIEMMRFDDDDDDGTNVTIHIWNETKCVCVGWKTNILAIIIFIRKKNYCWHNHMNGIGFRQFINKRLFFWLILHVIYTQQSCVNIWQSVIPILCVFQTHKKSDCLTNGNVCLYHFNLFAVQNE